MIVKSGDVIAEIETDKATMEVEAVDEGIIRQNYYLMKVISLLQLILL